MFNSVVTVTYTCFYEFIYCFCLIVANQNSEKGKPLSIKQWLAKYGLAAKHLTIIDALGSTFISHKAKYVSILDKYISGKVFNEVIVFSVCLFSLVF